VLPFWVVFFAVSIPIILIRDALVYIVMGRPDLTVTAGALARRGDMEMGDTLSHEEQGLLQEDTDSNGQDKGEDDEDSLDDAVTIYSPRSSTDNKACP
jgi:hypothetical protein